MKKSTFLPHHDARAECVVSDDLPAYVPISVDELSAVDAFLGDALAELLHPLLETTILDSIGIIRSHVQKRQRAP